jgi:type I restriction enzyme S subunit
VRPNQINHLRQTILKLAVRGQLVASEPSQESAATLLHRIQSEKEDLIRQDGLKRKSGDLQLAKEDLPFQIPPLWQWVPLQQLIVFGPQNGLSPKESSDPEAPRAITLTATTKGIFDPNHFKRVEANVPVESEFWLRPGDLLFQRGNTREYVGIAAYYTGEPGLFLYPDLMIKVRLSQEVSLRYIHLCAVAPHARAYFSTRASGAQTTMPKINQGILLKLPIPLPPLAEQNQIVSKVDELMGICDQLEKQLIEADARNRGLLEAVLHHALVDAPAVPTSATHVPITNVDTIVSAV